MLIYETKLAEDLERAFQEGSMHFDEKSAVHNSLRKISSYTRDKFMELWTGVQSGP